MMLDGIEHKESCVSVYCGPNGAYDCNCGAVLNAYRSALQALVYASTFVVPIARHLASNARGVGESLHEWSFVVDEEPATLTRTHISEAMKARRTALDLLIKTPFKVPV